MVLVGVFFRRKVVFVFSIFGFLELEGFFSDYSVWFFVLVGKVFKVVGVEFRYRVRWEVGCRSWGGENGVGWEGRGVGS